MNKNVGQVALRCLFFMTAILSSDASLYAAAVSQDVRARLAAGESLTVIVEVNGTAIDQSAVKERNRRRLRRDDASIRNMRAQGYARIKNDVKTAAQSSDAISLRDYSHLPMSVWRVSSLDALNRLEAQANIRAVHEDIPLHPNSVSDLAFISQPQTASLGGTGAGTVIAVIDGGLGNNYLSYADFGTCTAINTPATCRVIYNQDYYPGTSGVVTHGTNVSAIALGVASSAKLAMYNPFNGGTALTSDIISAMNDIVSRFDASTFNVVAVNMSLGDSSSHTTQCNSLNTHSTAYSAFNAPVIALTNLGVVTVVAAGNSGSKTGLSDPACVPGVVSVGAVYDGAYGSVSWGAPASCTDTTAADKITCFSQSASYLTILAPGSFVNAPDSSFQMSGTSQATPHVSGAVAVLRARYPAESIAQTIQRMKDTGSRDTDSANSQLNSRLNLLAAYNEATLLTLTGQGPTHAVIGGSDVYTLTVTNSGPLSATNVSVVNTLPAGATYVSASSGCSYASGKVTCLAPTLAAGASLIFTITVQWTISGPVYDVAALHADQNNSASATQQQVAFGSLPVREQLADAPLPLWAYLALGLLLLLTIQRTSTRSTLCTTVDIR